MTRHTSWSRLALLLSLSLTLSVGCGDDMPIAEDDDAAVDALVDGGQLGDGVGGDSGGDGTGVEDATGDAAGDVLGDVASDVDAGAPCEKDEDCDTPDSPCVKVACGAAKTCEQTQLAKGSKCDDGDACTPDDTCDDQGVCLPGAATGCDDLNPCTTDSCDKAKGCVHTPGGSDCSDGDACTEGDSCKDGACAPGVAKGCDDSDPCTDDSCDPKTGCVNTPNTATCDDGDACTKGDTCKDGKCASGAKVDCNDGQVCTADSCDKAKGCVNAPAAGPCDDGNACTVGDACGQGACLPGQVTSCDDDNPCTDDGCDKLKGCLHLANAVTCSDDDACTAGDVCKDSQCLSGAKVVCDDDNPCTADSCDPKSGCTTAPMPVGATCTDGNACTLGDGCDGKDQCASGTPDSCDDNNACTTDSCDPVAGCKHANNDKPCTDGSVCTTSDVCKGGKCVGGGTFDCDDGNPCTDDGCAPKTGCTTKNNTAKCDDNNSCTTGEACKDGSCAAVTPSKCDDGNVCTTESCDPLKGCQSTPNTAPCADGNVCTQDDTCKGGSCVAGTLQGCGDGNPCTTDSCDAKSGCVNLPGQATCSDGNACTKDDGCVGGECVAQLTFSCDDGQVCTADSCDPKKGCQHKNIDVPCSDGDPCTAGDGCKDGSCVPGPAADCDDGNVCTTDTCDKKGGCVSLPNTITCTDGNACTEGDTCAKGSCKPGKSVDCDDKNVCTADSCAVATGCVHSNVAALCTDGDVCTLGDVCKDGKCTSSGKLTCNDGNPCTTDSCDKAKGCTFAPNSNPCDDGNACTTGDVCSKGVCTAGKGKPCDDNNPCTTDSCDLGKGCVYTANTAPCSDGDACTVNDVCAKTTCTSGAKRVCTDGNPCTTDSCDKAKGCVYPNNSLPCDDGDACTTKDTCKNGSCGQFVKLDCDDKKVCTSDSCNSKTGCVNLPNTITCTDGDACTDGDQCAKGSCVPGKKKVCDDNTNCTTDSCDKLNGCQYKAVPAKSGFKADVKKNVYNGVKGVWSIPLPAHAYGLRLRLITQGDYNSSNEWITWSINGSTPVKYNAFSNSAKYSPMWNVAALPTGDGKAVLTIEASASVGSGGVTPWLFWTHGDACSDGDACTQGDGCVGAQCKPGKKLDCDDKNACTIDSCDKAKGCVNTAVKNGATCTDGTVCTDKDTCQSGKCVPGKALVCDDGNPCTTDSCDKVKGCQAAAAKDGLTCGGSGMCSKGGCVCTASTWLSSGSCVDCGCSAAGSVASGSAKLGSALQMSSAGSYDEFGRSVARSGDWMAVGVPYDDDKGSNAGAVVLFQKQANGSWAQKAKLFGSNAAPSDYLGYSVAMDGKYLVAGAYGEDDKGGNSGAAFVFELQSGGTWKQVAKLVASDGKASDYLGYNVDIDGTRVVLGAYARDSKGSSSGGAYVFDRQSNGSWTQSAVLLPATAAAGDQCGFSVAVSGGRVALGCRYDDDKGSSSGSVGVFELSGTTWKQVALLTAADGVTNDYLGYSVDIDGDWLVSGAYGDDDKGSGSGSVYVFQRTGGTWKQSAKLVPADGNQGDSYGIGVALGGGTLLVGAPYDDDKGTSSGSVYPYTYALGKGWTVGSKFTGPSSSHEFGWSVAVAEAGGAIGARVYSTHRGRAYPLSLPTRACDKAGKCTCKPGYGGDKCDKVVDPCLIPNYCDDGNGCTIDTCDKTSKKCLHSTAKDGTVCAANMICAKGTCVDAPHGPLDKIVIAGLHNAHNGNLGGIAGANALCNKEAKAAGRKEVFKAFLSSSKQNVKDLITGSDATALQVVNIKGQKMYDNWKDIFDGSYAADTSFYTFQNRLIDEGQGANPDWSDADGWTGSSTSGTYVSGKSCNDWTSSSSGVTGQNTELDLSRDLLKQESRSCNITLAVICVSVKGEPEDPTYGTSSNPGTSCLDILTKRPSLKGKSADYVIKTAKVKALSVYCDMSTEGGGYTFYPVNSGKQTYRVTDNDSCKDLGLTMVMPRSKAHWSAMLTKYGTSYFSTIPGVYKSSGGGNYTNCIMRHPGSYGSGCSGWRVADGGRWWMRDSKYSEPNGDYTANCWLSMYKWDVNDIRYNDGNCSYSTKKYICSTNDKK